MFEALSSVVAQTQPGPVLADLLSFLGTAKSYFLIFAGFSLVIFFHELGHFIAAKLANVKVDRFAVGFGRAIFAYRKGAGFTWGPTQPTLDRRIAAHVKAKRSADLQSQEKTGPSEAEIAEAMKDLGVGETEYCFNALPLGGYVKMLGQEDFTVDKSGEVMVKADPRAFTHKPISVRMFIVSAGVFMNLVFAAATFALVFMLGWQTIPAEVGMLQPGMPADQVGLRIGDRIVRVNGEAIADQADLQTAIGLASPDEPLKLTYERKDPATGNYKAETVSISPEMSPENNILRIGVAPPFTNLVGWVVPNPDLPKDQQIEFADRVVAVNGHPTSSLYQIQEALADQKGEWATVTVERPLEQADGQATRPTSASDKTPETKRLDVRWRARQYLMPMGKADEESGHLLGLVPRQRVKLVMSDGRAAPAGMQDGDVIVRWGGQTAPRLEEIINIRRENPREIRVTVYRPGEGEKSLTLVPKGGGPLARGVPADGVIWGSQENDKLVVADIVTNVTDKIPTPAAALKEIMPRGSLLTKVNDEPVQTWPQLTKKFIKLAGKDVKLTWTAQGAGEQSGTIHVPHTIGTTFDLPGARYLISIDGIARQELQVNGKRSSLSVNHWQVASEILHNSVGKDVKVVYENCLDRTRHEATVHVTPEMADTWVLRNIYLVDDLLTQHQLTILRETNPLKASLIGLRKTWWFIEQVYLVMQRMIFTRTMSVDQVSGPVGIVQMGSQVAAAGYTHLLYFLALISANLAVINFLPLPLMDGGVFMFLLIEKIKGSPLSVRVQVATQLIGLVLIIGIFLFVTFQDISKLVG